jgi:hypothetical protein
MTDKYFNEAENAMRKLDLSSNSQITTKEWWISLSEEKTSTMEEFSICPGKSFINQIIFDINGVNNSDTITSTFFYEKIGQEADWYLKNMVKVDISETYPNLYKCIDGLRSSKDSEILLIDTLVFLSLTGSLNNLITAVNKPGFIAWLETI